MSIDIAGKNAVVTGGANGIGRAIAELFVEEGARVLVADVAEPSGAPEDFIRSDVSTAEGAEAIAARARELFGRIHVLVNSAGIQRYGTVADTAEEVWDEVMAVNLKSMYLMARACIPLMSDAGRCSIINISSVQGLASQRRVAAYSASKGGVIALTRSMAVDLAPDIRANCICPGSVDTPMLRESAALFAAENPDEALTSWGTMHPVARIARPEEIASAALFLASDDASFVTGSVFVVDGGLTSLLGGT